MPDVFTQIVERRGTVERVPRGTRPVVELDLPAGAYVANFDLRILRDAHDRKTVDWMWTAAIVHPLPMDGFVPDAEDRAKAALFTWMQNELGWGSDEYGLAEDAARIALSAALRHFQPSEEGS